MDPVPLDRAERPLGTGEPKVSAIFLIGHKPIMEHPQAEEKEKAILNTKKHPLGDQLQALFQANDKVRAISGLTSTCGTAHGSRRPHRSGK